MTRKASHFTCVCASQVSNCPFIHDDARAWLDAECNIQLSMREDAYLKKGAVSMSRKVSTSDASCHDDLHVLYTRSHGCDGNLHYTLHYVFDCTLMPLQWLEEHQRTYTKLLDIGTTDIHINNRHDLVDAFIKRSISTVSFMNASAKQSDDYNLL